MSGVAVLLALAAAGCFAVSTAVQHHCAGAAPTSSTGTVGLLGHLLRRPFWLVGIAVSIGGFVLHAAAVRVGALAVVQPIMVLAIVFALPARAALDRCWPSRRAQLWAAVTTVGLVLFIVAAQPTAGRAPGRDGTAGLLLVGGGAIAALLSWAGSRAHSPVAGGVQFGAASGMLFGLVAGVLKFVVRDVTGGPAALLTGWHVWVLVGLGGWGLAVNQRAYRTAPLAVSLPVLNIVDPLVAIAFGAWVFGEKPADQPLAVLVETVGLVVMAVGAVLLTRPTQTDPGRLAGRGTGSSTLAESDESSRA